MQKRKMNYESDLYEELNLKKRQPINLIQNLMGRELGTNSYTLYTTTTFNDFSNRNEQTKFNLMKRVYLCINPNYSILNVKIPNCFLRRFSPDGRYLIAFNQYLNGIQIFSFKGSSAGISDIDKINEHQYSTRSPSDETCFRESNNLHFQDRTNFNESESDQFRSKAFSTYFKETANLKLTENSEQIHRECALFYKNSYLIVASSSIVNEENLPPYDQLAANNEAIHYNTVENYTIYLIDIQKGILCDKIKFNADKINLTHNQSLSLFKNVFSVLSQQNQTIHIYNLVDASFINQSNTHKGRYKFLLVKQIGRFCFSDDFDFIHRPSVLCSQSNGAQKQKSSEMSFPDRMRFNRRQMKFRDTSSAKGFSETCFTGMKQRIVSFFYKEALETNTLNQFHLNLSNLLKLRMYKMQLLDEKHMLIKYVNLDHMVCQKASFTAVGNRPTQAASTSTNPSNPSSNNTAFVSGPGLGAENATTTNFTNIPIILNENTVPFYFVLYDTQSAIILNIFKNTSSDLLDVYENLQDYFSMSILDGFSAENEQDSYGSSFNFHTLASNNLHANQLFKRNVKNILKLNKSNEMTKCLLSQLPISSQSYTSTPYLDHSLFSYDEKLISNLERPKPIGDQIIRFNMRDSGRLCFRLYPGLQMAYGSNQSQNNQQSSALYKRLVAFIWHPREPFCISVQRAPQEYNVNFHVYSKNNLD